MALDTIGQRVRIRDGVPWSPTSPRDGVLVGFARTGWAEDPLAATMARTLGAEVTDELVGVEVDGLTYAFFTHELEEIE